MSTNIVAYVDAPGTEDGLQKNSLDLFRTSLLLSRDLPISVFLIRRVQTTRTLEVEERESLHSLLSILSSHVHRVATLVIETNLSSSLPDAVHLLTANTSVLEQVKYLVLTSNHDDSIPSPHVQTTPFFPQSNGNVLTTRSYSTLTTLSVDGRNIFPILHYDVVSAFSRLETLYINHLTYLVDGYFEERVYKLFETIAGITLRFLNTLGFHDFEIPPPVTRDELGISRPCPLLSFSIDRLVIKETNRESMAYILDCVTNPKELCLIGCYFNATAVSQSSQSRFQDPAGSVRLPTLRLPDCEQLTLVNTEAEDEDLASIISQWNGQRLSRA
ncbi:hypothetical protein EST38_g2662 [Candolleomyces aberdarensis]|uniref:Uncharacterized protein n=1 Tax=Candolleomyces aberdarensis TaxID=2316362 RepID=A0A4Q2DU33_9AGAR|nr:hypothetical protein EST38_g2662 [Candolleomyces aberdarensis]